MKLQGIKVMSLLCMALGDTQRTRHKAHGVGVQSIREGARVTVAGYSVGKTMMPPPLPRSLSVSTWEKVSTRTKPKPAL